MQIDEDVLREVEMALVAVLDRDVRNTCQHEETHRGGFLWEICDQCGAKWADDEGGKPEWKDPKEWGEATAALAKLRKAMEDTPMTETPERIWVTFARKDFGRDPKDKGSSSYIGDANDGPVDADAEYVPATALEAAQARVRELEADVLTWRKVAQSATPGGSEYMNPEYTRAFIQERREACHEAMKRAVLAERNAKSARREALEEAAKVADAETGWIGEPYQSNMDFGPNVGPRIATAIRALMEKPND